MAEAPSASANSERPGVYSARIAWPSAISVDAGKTFRLLGDLLDANVEPAGTLLLSMYGIACGKHVEDREDECADSLSLVFIF